MRRFFRALAALAMPLCFAAAPISAGGQTPEVRAIWASRFEWPSSNQTTAKDNIDTMMQRAKDNNFNTVFFQVRGDCSTHYPSPDEPWASTYSYTNPGWDPLAYAITAAHTRGLKLHAYINTHTFCSSGATPPSTTPQHPYNLHGPSASPANRWALESSGGDLSAVDGYYWISPGNPAASEWTRRQIMHVVKNYDVDGIHLDRIRTPGTDYSYDAATVARFNGVGNPDNLGWADFMRSQITRDVRHLYGEIQYHKPNVLLSAAPFGIMVKDATTNYQGTGTQAYHSWYQDAWGWLEAGAMDFMVPQIYWTVGSSHPFEDLLADWQNHRYGRYIVPGSTTGGGTISVSAMLAMTAESRSQGAKGHTIFSYSSMTNYWNAYKTGPYAQAAAFPDMPWKSAPTQGTIVGYVKDNLGNPVLDAVVTRPDDTTKYLSAADGLFAILKVTPGTNLSVSGSKAGVGSATVSSISVTAGGTTLVNIILGVTSAGQVKLDKTSYGFAGEAIITVEDADLSAPTISVNAKTNAMPAGVSVTLTKLSAGIYTGTVGMKAPLDTGGTDPLVATVSGDVLTVTYADANTGGGSPAVVVKTATVTAPPDIILESYTSSGSVTPNPPYLEYAPPGSSWSFSTAKSTAPGLSGTASRYIGDNSLGAYVEFTFPVENRAYYHLQITQGVSTNHNSPGATYRLSQPGHSDVTGTFDLSRFVPGLVNSWYNLTSRVLLDRGTAVLRITNNHSGSANSENRFNIDAVRLAYEIYAPVALSAFSVD